MEMRMANKRELYISKTTTVHVSRVFVHFLANCDMKLPNFMRQLLLVMEYMNTKQKFSFSFSKLRYGPFGLNCRKFCKHVRN